MVFGVCIDIFQAGRVPKAWRRIGDRVVAQPPKPPELALFAQQKRPERFLAMRFAAKEAIVKAMGTGFAHGMWLKDAGVIPNRYGRPEVVFSERGRAKCNELGIAEGHLTLSDEAGLVVAVAILMKTAGTD